MVVKFDATAGNFSINSVSDVSNLNDYNAFDQDYPGVWINL
jgi:hypothetical protein